MKTKLSLILICVALTSGCSRYERKEEPATVPPPVVVTRGQEEDEISKAQDGTPKIEIQVTTERPRTRRTPVKVKGIYISAYVAGTKEMMDEIIHQIDQTEINAVVIDVKDDNGRITFSMDTPVVSQIGAVKRFIPDIEGLVKTLKAHNIYTIARVVAFRDPFLPEKKPELALKLADGSIYRDNKGLAWVNPYKKEIWDYLVEVGIGAHEAGFDEVQFDYIRFSTEKGVNNVVYDEADMKGRTRTDIITEFIDYAHEKLEEEGVYVAADVFGAIIESGVDSDSVGQSYGDMANHLDYICPMIYPSHYGDGNFGIEHPDTEPYNTILAALKGSREVLDSHREEGASQAAVRPWLQDFTASYLNHYIHYGDEQVRQQIQAVYDAGYDEWMLWSASCRYHWGGLKTAKEAEAGQSGVAKKADETKGNGAQKGAEPGTPVGVHRAGDRFLQRKAA